MAAANPASERIGDLLVREGLITREQLDKALQEQKQNGTRVGYNLIKLGFIQELELIDDAREAVQDARRSTSRSSTVDPKIAKLIPADLAIEEPRAPAQARRPAAHRRHGRPDEPRRPRGPQVHHALRHLPGHRGRVHAQVDHREDLRQGSRRRADVGADGHDRRDRGRRGRGRRGEGGGGLGGGDAGADGGRAGRQAAQRDPHRRREARRVGHPLRVLRARHPRALPHRRRAAGSHEAADEAQGGADLALQDHVAT